jgi:hypothetical protein
MGGFLKKHLIAIKTAVSAPEAAPAKAAQAASPAAATPAAPDPMEARVGMSGMAKRRRRGGRMSTVLSAVDEKLGG